MDKAPYATPILLELKQDGDAWSVGLAGTNLQETEHGFGKTKSEALRAFANILEPKPAEPSSHGRRPASGSIASYGYNAAAQVLEVEFASGGVYQYYDVPPYVFDELNLCKTPGYDMSHGKYIQSNVKGLYRYAKVDG